MASVRPCSNTQEAKRFLRCATKLKPAKKARARTAATIMSERKIALIGGGASAVLILVHLAQSPRCGKLSVTIYDRDGNFARGVAYSTEQDCHLLNVRATNMSAFHELKDDFALWAKEKGFTADDFVPRKHYGDYLHQRMMEAREKVSVRLAVKDVKSCRKKNGGFEIDGEWYHEAILASGNVRPLRVKIEGSKIYHDNPWRLDYTALKDKDHIGLIGSGLSAVDAAMALAANGFKGKVSIFSRHGIFPAIHANAGVYDSFLVTLDDQRLPPSKMLKRVRHEIKIAAAKNMPWQAVIDSLRPHTNIIWQNWSKEHRATFTRHLLTLWNIHRHRMAPQIAESLKGTDINFIRSRVEKISGNKVVLKNGADVELDAVINCLGYRYDEAERDFEVSGKIGPARFGKLFETTAIPEIRAQAHGIAQKILKNS